jgi:hypothetical protein
MVTSAFQNNFYLCSMNWNYQSLLPSDFSASSRVWIYQSNRIFGFAEALEIEKILNSFTTDWNSHGTPVKGYGNLFFGQFIVLIADETATGVSGCSTDSSVRLIKEIEKAFNVNLFDRQALAFVVKDKTQIIPLSQVQYAIDNNFIGPETIYFNNIVSNKQELESSWMIPVKESWMSGRLKLQKV